MRITCLVAGLLLAGVASAGPPDKGKTQKAVPEAEQGEGVTLTVYNQNFVVVRERRLMDLKQGRASVRFREVAATIVPETVQFSVLKKPDAARVVEQSYEFDLVSAAKLLDKYIDRDLAVVARDGGTLKGKLLSFDDSQLVLQTDKGVDLVPRGDNIKDIQLSSLPANLLTRPTLVWQLDAKAAGKELVKVAYAAGKMSWRVDYRARVNQAGDRMDLAGWVTVTNQTGTTFKEARLKLMAGELNLVPSLEFVADPNRAGELGRPMAEIHLGDRRIMQQAFAEYHLYELARLTTLSDRATKQVELLDVERILLKRRYELRAGETRVTVLLEFKNEEKLAKGLGVPLPKGPVRVFQQGDDGAPEFVGQDQLDHTPKDEPVRLRLGYAFDLTARRTLLAQREDKKQLEQDFSIRLRNHKKEAVTIDVIEGVNARENWEMVRKSHDFTRRDVGTLVFPITVGPNAEVVLTYTIRYLKPESKDAPIMSPPA
jgi:hypothetical protein